MLSNAIFRPSHWLKKLGYFSGEGEGESIFAEVSIQREENRKICVQIFPVQAHFVKQELATNMYSPCATHRFTSTKASNLYTEIVYLRQEHKSETSFELRQEHT